MTRGLLREIESIQESPARELITYDGYHRVLLVCGHEGIYSEYWKVGDPVPCWECPRQEAIARIIAIAREHTHEYGCDGMCDALDAFDEANEGTS